MIVYHDYMKVIIVCTEFVECLWFMITFDFHDFFVE